MYEEFFGLSEKPFALTPNPRFVYYSEPYGTAEEAILYGLAQNEGLMLVTGAAGTGKTMLCRTLVEKLTPDRHQVALISNPHLNGLEVLQALVEEFGLATGNSSRKELLDVLVAYCRELLADGKTCVVIVDEAQHLNTDFLEQIRVLSNLETDRENLVQIVLVGQPELLGHMRTPQLARLDQRVTVRCALTPLTREETVRYIDHRLNVAGGQGRIRFHPAEVRRLHRSTGGVPRLINLACDRALLSGFADRTMLIGHEHVDDAIASLRADDEVDTSSALSSSSALVGANRSTLVSPKPSAVVMPRQSALVGRKQSALVNPRPLVSPKRVLSWLIGSAALAVAFVVGFTFFWFALDGGAELLAWQGALATSAGEAEQAYVRIARHHPESRQRERALLRLAQLQIAKGDAREALRWLRVLNRDYPDADGERQYWMARALLTRGDTLRACSVTPAVSRAATGMLGPAYSSIHRQCEAFALRTHGSSTGEVTKSSGVDTLAIVTPAGSPQPHSSLP